jgi:hypothetical protein
MEKYDSPHKIPVHIHNRGKIYVLVHNYPNKKIAMKVAEIPAGRTYHTLVKTYVVNGKNLYSVYWSEK